jgi:mono/diheme cytochrome c family protein
MKLYACALVCGFLCVSSVLALRAQGKHDMKNEESVYAELAKAPPKYQRMRNPMENDKDAPVAGGILFEEHCESCHGKEGIGGKKAPSLRAPEVREAKAGAIFWILSNGVVRKKMPVWSKLPEPERWQLVSYIQSLSAEKKTADEKSR